jgi:hypothetical protein
VTANLARSQLENAVGFETDAGDAPGTQTVPGFEDAKFFVEGDDIDGEAHPEGVDARRGANEEASAVFERRFAEKAEQSGKKSISETDARSDGYGLLRNGEGQVLHRGMPLRRFSGGIVPAMRGRSDERKPVEVRGRRLTRAGQVKFQEPVRIGCGLRSGRSLSAQDDDAQHKDTESTSGCTNYQGCTHGKLLSRHAP